MSAGVRESERSAEAGCAGDGVVVGAVRALAIFAHQRNPWRWSEPGIAGHEEGGQ